MVRRWMCICGALLLALMAGPPVSASVAAATPVVPERLGTMAPLKATGSAAQRKVAALDARQAAAIAKRITSAYHGASAAAQIYRSADLSDGAVLMAVSAASPGLFTTSRDAADDGLSKPFHEVVTIGQVECLVTNTPRAVGTPVKPSDTNVTRCQRSTPKFTVIVDPMAAGPAMNDPTLVAAWVNQAWKAMLP